MSAAPQIKDMLKFDIEVVRGPHIGLKMSFVKGSITLGRGPENDIVLANDPRTSRQHAEIKQRDQDFVIVNLSQRNFIMVNGNNVQTEVISNDSVILIGDSEIRLRVEKPAPIATPAPVPPPISQKQDLIQLKPKAAPAVKPAATAPATKPTMPTAPPKPMATPAYQQQGPVASMGSPQPRPMKTSSSSGGLASNPKVRFYGIVAIVGLLAWFVLSPTNKGPAKDPNAFRTSDLALADVRAAEKNTEALLTMKKEKYDTVQYRRAQENFVRGFRDYQQGQYARAREAFQVVINLDPENELAKRYLHLSKLKFDELVKFNMIQGNRYREKRNWRMCQSNYNVVMTMLQNRRDDPAYKEAKQFYQECTLNLEGRF